MMKPAQAGVTWVALQEERSRQSSISPRPPAVRKASISSPAIAPNTSSRSGSPPATSACSAFSRQLGRELSADEDRVNGPNAAVLRATRSGSHAFNADPAVIGRRLTVRGEPYTIVGVIPPAFPSRTIPNGFSIRCLRRCVDTAARSRQSARAAARTTRSSPGCATASAGPPRTPPWGRRPSKSRAIDTVAGEIERSMSDFAWCLCRPVRRSRSASR